MSKCKRIQIGYHLQHSASLRGEELNQNLDTAVLTDEYLRVKK